MTQETHYRCFFIDATKGFMAVEEFESVNDSLAVERAITLYCERGAAHLGFEVWQGDRMVRRRAPIQRTYAYRANGRHTENGRP